MVATERANRWYFMIFCYKVPAWRTGRLCGGLHVCAQWNPGGVDIDILEILGKEQRC